MLHLILFEILVTDQNNYMLENYEVTYLTSGKDILRWKKETETGINAIVMADPDFDLNSQKRASVLSQMGIESESLRGGITRQLKERNFSRLSGSRDEAKEIAFVLSERMKIPVRLYLDQEALEEVLMSIESPRILHFATHGYFLDDPERPAGMIGDLVEPGIPDATWEHPSLRSGIVLAGANRSLKEGKDEGLVSAIKIESLRLNKTELVVLSACDTGVGRIQSGEGVFGLKRSFVLAGAQSLVLSLWKVPDRTTRELMTSFYSHWSSGLPKSKSLRKARLQILKTYENPFYWAAFQLVGNPN
jgi:CHAT domain-containing protein